MCGAECRGALEVRVDSLVLYAKRSEERVDRAFFLSRPHAGPDRMEFPHGDASRPAFGGTARGMASGKPTLLSPPRFRKVPGSRSHRAVTN
jgi:hypothetical protein